jgi:putative flippase GtrA
VNFACYSLALLLLPGDGWWRPALAVAFGSAAGLIVNFANAKLFVYKS